MSQPALKRVNTKNFSGNKQDGVKIFNIYIMLHGTELWDEKLKYHKQDTNTDVEEKRYIRSYAPTHKHAVPASTDRMDVEEKEKTGIHVRIFSYIGMAGVINVCNILTTSIFNRNMLEKINKELNDSENKKSSYSIIHEKMQSQREDVYNFIKNSKNDNKMTREVVENQQNIRTSNPILDKIYTNDSDIYSSKFGIFCQLSDNQIGNIIQFNYVIDNILNNDDLSDNIKKRFTDLILDTIIFNIKHLRVESSNIDEVEQSETDDKTKINIEDDVDEKKDKESENLISSLKNKNLSFKHKENKITITDDKKQYNIKYKFIMTDIDFSISDFNYKLCVIGDLNLQKIYLSDIINFFIEVGCNVLNIIDSSCRIVYDNTNKIIDDKRLIEFQEDELTQTNINYNLGGKIINKKNLDETKNRKTKNRKTKNRKTKNRKTKNRKTKNRKKLEKFKKLSLKKVYYSKKV